MTHFLFFSTFFGCSMCIEKCLRDLLVMPHHSRRRHLGRAWMERSERTVRCIQHHQIRHLLPFSYPNVCKTRLSGQLFLLHSQLPWHEDLWISPLVSVSHWLHRRFYVIGRSHCPGRPTLRRKLAKLFGCKPQQIQSGIEIPVDHQPTDQALIRAMPQGHALFDMPTAGAALG